MRKLFDFRLSKFSISRPLLSYSKIQYLIGLLIRNKKFQLFGKDFSSKEYLNCGSGPNIKENFINLDWLWMPGVDLCWDITKGLPLSNQSIKGIYSEHLLEHIPFDQVVPLLSEFRRVLKKDGVIRIVVPDAELYLDLYQSAKNGDPVPFPYGNDPTVTPMMHVNRVFVEHGHRYGYDYETLCLLLSRAGFSNVAKLSFSKGRDPNLLIDSKSREIGSLYVEACCV